MGPADATVSRLSCYRMGAKSGTSFLRVMVMPDFSFSSLSSSFSFSSFFSSFTFSASLICSHQE